MLKLNTYMERRSKLLNYLSTDAAFLVPAAEHYPRNWDSEYFYDQDADFYYLTGFNEPQAMLLLLPGNDEVESILFCRPNNELEELWLGKRCGLDAAISKFGVDAAYDIDDLEPVLLDLLQGRTKLYYPLGKYQDLDEMLLAIVKDSRKAVRRGGQALEELKDCRTIIRQMRAVKTEEELTCMRQAMQISGAAHIALMEACKPGMHEYEIEALFAYKCRSKGADTLLAYDSIVGGGANACILHYQENNAVLNAGEMLLVDAGCRYDHYTSDITRTYPIDGKFTPQQQQLYNAVLKAQEEVIAAVKPGVTLLDLQNLAIRILTEGLVELGILSGAIDELIANNAHKEFYPHLIGHWLGLDTHDPSAVKQGDEWVPLVPGVVLTVEPGLYIQPTAKNVDKKWLGMGVRIEDNILVTEDGNINLTSDVPKSVEAIEAVMAGK